MSPPSASDPISPEWPAGVVVPGRLAQLVEYVRGSGSVLFGDLELDNLADDFLVAYHGGDDPALVEQLPAKFAFFARGGGGGQVGLWRQDDGPADAWPVVSLDSEGGMMVAGENIEDFIRVIAGHWTEADDPGIYGGGDQLRAWAMSVGLKPHDRSAERLRALNPATLGLLRWFAAQKRDVHRALYPDRSLVIDAVPGVSVGPIRLGAPRAGADAALGTPEETAFDLPYVVRTERASARVTGVTLYSGLHVVRLPDGFEPLLATEADATRWLKAHASDAALDGNELVAPSLGLKMTIGTGYGSHHDPASFRWVNSLKFAAV